MAEPSVERNPRTKRRVEDAVRLLDYAIQSGFRAADGRTTGWNVVAGIVSGRSRTGLLAVWLIPIPWKQLRGNVRLAPDCRRQSHAPVHLA